MGVLGDFMRQQSQEEKSSPRDLTIVPFAPVIKGVLLFVRAATGLGSSHEGRTVRTKGM